MENYQKIRAQTHSFTFPKLVGKFITMLCCIFMRLLQTLKEHQMIWLFDVFMSYLTSELPYPERHSFSASKVNFYDLVKTDVFRSLFVFLRPRPVSTSFRISDSGIHLKPCT